MVLQGVSVLQIVIYYNCRAHTKLISNDNNSIAHIILEKMNKGTKTLLNHWNNRLTSLERGLIDILKKLLTVFMRSVTNRTSRDCLSLHLTVGHLPLPVSHLQQVAGGGLVVLLVLPAGAGVLHLSHPPSPPHWQTVHNNSWENVKNWGCSIILTVSSP